MKFNAIFYILSDFISTAHKPLLQTMHHVTKLHHSTQYHFIEISAFNYSHSLIFDLVASKVDGVKNCGWPRLQSDGEKFVKNIRK